MSKPLTGAPTGPLVRVYMLGRFHVLVRDRVLEDRTWRRRTARQLFKVLLTRPGRRMTRDELVELFWPESNEDAASTNLRSTLHALRRVIDEAADGDAPGIVFSDRDSVWLAPDERLWVDADAFERAVVDARHVANPLPLLEQASALYQGDYLPTDLYEDWAASRRNVLKRTWTGVQLRLAQQLKERGEPDAAILAVQRALESDRTDERAARELMRLLIDQGLKSEATKVFQELEHALQEELGVAPSEQTLDLHRAAGAPNTLAVRASEFRCAYPFPRPALLVGRDAELERAKRSIDRARTRGQAIIVSGPAGVGKSSLVGRIVESAQRSGMLCLAGGSYDTQNALPLEPFQEALAEYVLHVWVEPPEERFASATSQLADVVRDLRQYMGISGHLTGDIGDGRARLFGAVLTFLRRACERAAVLLCLEDLHASDAATLQLFHYLARQTRTTRLVILGTFRSEEMLPGEPLSQLVGALIRERLAERIVLNPLDELETGRLIASLVPGPISETLRRFIYSATEGNPLFTEQIVLSLREEGRFNRLPGSAPPTSEPIRNLPKVMRDVIEERLSHLSASGRETLETASVLGASFDHGTLLNVVQPADEAILLSDLDEAIRARVLRETASGYAFGHALLQQGLYSGMTGPRRMLLHARAGELLERATDEDVPERAARLAHHFTLASPSPLNRSKAFRYSLQAGRAAAAVDSYREAMTHFSTACELMDQSGVDIDPAMRLEVLEGRGRAERELALWGSSITTYRQVLSQSQTAIQRARARSMIAYGLQHTGDISGALEEARAGMRELAEASDAESIEQRLYLSQIIAWCWYLQGRHRDLIALGEQMLGQAAKLSQPRPLMLALGVIATGYMGAGDVRNALSQREQTLAASLQTGDRISIAIARENLGFQFYLGGQFPSAREHLERALEIYRETASELRAVNARQHLCRVWLAEGELKRALEQAQLAVDLEEAGHERWAADGYQILGSIHALRSQWTHARSNLEAGLNIRQRVGDVPGMVESIVSVGMVDEYEGNWVDADQRYKQALELAHRMDEGPFLVLAQRRLGSLRMVAGNYVEGEAFLKQALELATGIPESLEYGPALLAMAEWNFRQNYFDAAMVLVEKALAVPATLEHVLATRLLMARLHLRAGDRTAAMGDAKTALTLAERVDSPHWLSSTHLAMGDATDPTASKQNASHDYELALQFADKAHAPLWRMLALDAYSTYLESKRSAPQALTAMKREATAIRSALHQSL